MPILGHDASQSAICRFFLFFQAYGKGFQAAQNEPAVERRQCRTGGEPDELEFFGQFVRAAYQYAGYGVVVSCQIFGRAVQYDVGAQLERALENR